MMMSHDVKDKQMNDIGCTTPVGNCEVSSQLKKTKFKFF